ncbi:HNH endonuclease signature motif containing protein [Bacillus weihaiensis]|uniref:HNH endonuclease signature motif containing protein n=1 Tax=Bacillus weihaiensis TaxID=1547283 RepID=UPI002357A037|nr:HNH endonuclease [Bacillus weihaiensis]
MSVTVEGVWNFIKGVGVAIYEIAEGLISLVIDAGIIAISNNIPDFIEPEFLKKAANTRVETFAGTLEQIIDDPIIVLESVAQSLSDTSEKEGIMYVTGGAATSLIPYVGQSKYLKLLKVEKDKATNTKAVNPAIAQKVKEIVQYNKVFEGFKKETVELYKDVKNGGTQFVDDVTHFLGRTLFPDQNLQMSTANSVPLNVFSRATVEDRIDSVVSRSSVKVEEKGTGDGTKGTVKVNLKNIDEFIDGTKTFDDVVDDFARLYSEKIQTNKTWSWNKSFHGGEHLTARQRKLIKEKAIEDGLIPNVNVIKADGMRYGFADFKSAGLVVETKDLPESLWLKSDEAQFEWLDNVIGGRPEGMTWHHTEVPGKMELVPFGIHNITIHNGGRSTGMWADAPR